MAQRNPQWHRGFLIGVEESSMAWKNPHSPRGISNSLHERLVTWRGIVNGLE